jgi:hypothetical protein
MKSDLMEVLVKTFIIIVGFGIAIVIIAGNLNDGNQLANEPEIRVIDGCEYIVSNGPNMSKTLTHKGNCKNH